MSMWGGMPITMVDPSGKINIKYGEVSKKFTKTFTKQIPGKIIAGPKKIIWAKPGNFECPGDSEPWVIFDVEVKYFIMWFVHVKVEAEISAWHELDVTWNGVWLRGRSKIEVGGFQISVGAKMTRILEILGNIREVCLCPKEENKMVKELNKQVEEMNKKYVEWEKKIENWDSEIQEMEKAINFTKKAKKWLENPGEVFIKEIKDTIGDSLDKIEGN